MIFDIEFYASADGDPVTFQFDAPLPLIGVGEQVTLADPRAAALGGEHWRVRERRFLITVSRYRVMYFCEPATNSRP